MRSLLGSLALLSLTVILSTACTKADHTNPIRAAKGTLPPTEPKGEKTVDYAKLNETDRAALLAKAADVVQLRMMLKTADHIFEQVWEKIWETKYAPVMNVFKAVDVALKAKYADNGVPFQSLVTKKDSSVKLRIQSQCREADYLFETSGANTEGQVRFANYTLWSLTCSGGSPAKNKMADIVVGMKDGLPTYKILFNKANLEKSLGKGLVILSSNLVACDLSPQEDGRLALMECSGVGQDRVAFENYMEFSKLTFQRNSKTPLSGEAVEYKFTNSGGEKLKSYKIEDRPLINVLNIIYAEEKGTPEAAPRDEKPKTVIPPSAKPAVPVAESQIAPETLSTTTIGRQEALSEQAATVMSTPAMGGEKPISPRLRRPPAPENREDLVEKLPESVEDQSEVGPAT